MVTEDTTTRIPPAAPPIVVDLDGTLIASDLLAESIVGLVRTRIVQVVLLPIWLLQGRGALKRRLADHVSLAVDVLPYRADLVAWLREEHAAARPLILATAADERYAASVSAHLGIFSEVLASDGVRNLKGPHKAAALVARFQERGFVYAGDSRADDAVWARAAGAVVVGGAVRREASVTELCPVVRRFPAQGRSFPQAVVKALRPHQWSKNLLIFVPYLASHSWTDPHAGLLVLITFATWSLVASGVYVLNDTLDVEADRRHARKRLRPFASGDLPLLAGLVAGPGLMVAGLAGLAFMSMPAAGVLLVYIVLTTCYSLVLKRKPLVDLFALSTLYTLRIVSGGAVIQHYPTIWLLTFSTFLFLSLACLKRYTEILANRSEHRVVGRGYVRADLGLLLAMGIASGFQTAVVLMMYLQSSFASTLYKRPELLLGLVPLALFWQCRLWLAAMRGQMHDDPIVYSATDWVSWVVIALGGVCTLLAIAA
jgi:4-hydroxybenzoate polyprenyltransferase